jgi:RimJ/RimL family protein N-acetyltransferase
MKSYWEGSFIKLRLFKNKDINEFFYQNGYYCYMNKGHFEWERVNEFPNFDSYFKQNHTMTFDHNFSLIIALLDSDRPIGIMQVYDTSTRNGTYYLGIYLLPEFDYKEYYLEVINIIKSFMNNELRYNEGFITLSDDQKVLLNLLNNEKFDKCAIIKNRYFHKIDQHIYLIKK